MYIRFHFNPIRELEWMIRALGIFSGIKYLSRRRRTRSTLHLYMAGLPSWEMVDMIDEHCRGKPSYTPALDWARALGSVRMDSVAEGEYAWAAIDVDIRGAPGDKGVVVKELHGCAPGTWCGVRVHRRSRGSAGCWPGSHAVGSHQPIAAAYS
jgi:hypothetical protein